MKVEVEIDVAEELVSRYELEKRVRKEAILGLFSDGKIPSGRASRELGLTRLQFMELLKDRGIPAVTYNADDLEQDMATLDRLRPRIEENLRSARARRFE